MNEPYRCDLRPGPDGRIIGKTEIVAGKPTVWSYAYDKAGRLTGATRDGRTVCDIGYDREGRRSRDYFPHLDTHYRNFTYSVMDNRLQRAGNNGYTHDKNGFRSIWNHGGQYTLYEYGPDYRLMKAEKRETGEVFEFTHDDQGRRAAKYRNGRAVETYHWLDFLRLDGFHDGESGYRFAYRNNERTPYAMQREDGAEAYLFYDQVGSLRVVANADGEVIKEILYDPFGGIIEDSNPGFRLPIGFAGGLHDRDLGFVRFGWRDYDTFTGRWTAPDPIGDKGGDTDWYGYCLDDPVNGVDPVGLLKNEYGEDVPDGRIITEYVPGLDMLFGGIGTSKHVKKRLAEQKEEYTDENDWKMKKELDNEASDYNLLKGIWDTVTTDTDEEIYKKRIGRAKRRIGK
ncbi:RHS repeat domain-containing protein [Pseudodesulfovibrio sp.]|uniref:RHS repeat domain-containing protein n=1 Tax=unclassified Pseudodesulfovibrio TaxID=2661612 RepID=UPI003AFFE334